jgi:hypothetical protein
MFAQGVTTRILRTLVAVVAVLRTVTFDALASFARSAPPAARCSILDYREDASIRRVADVLGARVAIVTHYGREVAGAIRIVAAVLGACVVVVAVLGALAFGAVIAAVPLAGTAKQVFKADDGA